MVVDETFPRGLINAHGLAGPTMIVLEHVARSICIYSILEMLGVVVTRRSRPSHSFVPKKRGNHWSVREYVMDYSHSSDANDDVVVES